MLRSFQDPRSSRCFAFQYLQGLGSSNCFGSKYLQDYCQSKLCHQKYVICLPEISNQSEGFSRTGYLLPARGTPGVSPDGEGSWDAAAAVAAAVVAVTWKFRSTFWLGNYIWSLSLWNWTQMGHLGTSVPGFCTEFRYLSYGQSGLAWGAIFEKIIKIQENALFQKMNMSKKSRNVIFPKKKKLPEAQCRKRSRKLLRTPKKVI